MLAILFPIVMGSVGFGVDYATWLVRKQQLQAIVDATALAVVSDMQVAGYDRGRAQAVAEGQVRSLADGFEASVGRIVGTVGPIFPVVR